MKNLLYKEFRLVIHPTTIMFLALSAMVLIPNYPYYITFFYTSLGIFFTCLNGRENNDIFYTMTLPVRKCDIVRSRFLFVVIIQLIQVLVAIPFALLRQSFTSVEPNAVGMEANVAFFGLSFIMMGIFNLVFFLKYYKAPDKVGKHFAVASIIEFVYLAIAETCAHAIPLFRDKLDTYDHAYMPEKLAILAIGILVYIILNILALKLSEKNFEALDL